MMDSFDAKRGMVKQLLDMLKRHASEEVDSGLKKPEGEGDMHGVQVEKVEILPDHEMDHSTPEHEIETKLIPEGNHTANMGYSRGGYTDDRLDRSSQNGQIPSAMTDEEAAEAQRKATEGSSDYDEKDADAQSAPFSSFMGKKRKK